MKEVRIGLSGARLVPHPYPVVVAGFSEAIRYNFKRTISHSETFEVCLRYDSTAECAVDTIGGQTYRTPFPHVYIKPPNTPYSNEIDDIRNALFFQYRSSLYPQFKERGLLPDGYFVEFAFNAKVQHLFAEFIALLQRSQEFGIADRIDTLCFTILQEIQLFAQARHQTTPEVRTKLEQIASFIQLHCCRKIDFERLAADYGLSRRTFYRQWKHEFKTTPARFQFELKMKEAAQLLQESDEPLSHIAKRLQMRDSVYFCKAFRDVYKCTPMEFRRKTGTANFPMRPLV
jgi:AraC-like DNA-binding protein